MDIKSFRDLMVWQKAMEIAEGRSRRHSREFLQLLSVSLGSLAGIGTPLELALRLKLLPREESKSVGASAKRSGVCCMASQ